MDTSSSLLDFGPYTSYILTSVGITLSLLTILLWRSLRQLSSQKKALSKSKHDET